MPKMKLSPEQWEEVKKASEAGVEDSQLSEDFGITKASIRKRRQLDAWMTPRKLEEQKAVAKAKAVARQLPNDVSQLSQTPSGEASIASKLLRDGEFASIAAMSILLKKLTQASENPDSVADLATVGDVSVAAKTARNIAGLDKPETAVQINLASVWGEPGAGKSPGPDDVPFLVESRVESRS